MTRSSSTIVALVIAGLVTLSADENWPQFRGPRSGVAADDPALPDSWSAVQNIAWKIELPGRGWSSPVVWGDHVFVTAAVDTHASEEPLKPTPSYTPRSFGGPMSGRDVSTSSDPHRWVLYDIELGTGKIRWERTIRTAVPFESKHQKNSYASETPVTDGERVYAYFGNLGLFAFDMHGTPVWSKPMGPFKVRNGWWHASSPVLHGDRVYVVNDNDEQSFIAAFNKKSGQEVWRVTRDEGSNWTSPFVWENDRRTEIVTAGTQKIRSYDMNGTLLWTLTGMSSIDIPTPVAGHGLLFVTSGYPGDQLRPAYAIRAGASGDISLKNDESSNAFITWSHPNLGPYNPSPLVYGDYYYTLFDRGFISCHDAKSGKEIYGRQRIAADAAGFTASPWAYNGKIFALSEDGDTYVLQAGPELKVLGKNSLGEMTLATPAIARGGLIIRTATRLYRVATTKPASAAR
jgi:outer membrane protein assembly factor BamB